MGPEGGIAYVVWDGDGEIADLCTRYGGVSLSGKKKVVDGGISKPGSSSKDKVPKEVDLRKQNAKETKKLSEIVVEKIRNIVYICLVVSHITEKHFEGERQDFDNFFNSLVNSMCSSVFTEGMGLGTDVSMQVNAGTSKYVDICIRVANSSKENKFKVVSHIEVKMASHAVYYKYETQKMQGRLQAFRDQSGDALSDCFLINLQPGIQKVVEAKIYEAEKKNLSTWLPTEFYKLSDSEPRLEDVMLENFKKHIQGLFGKKTETLNQWIEGGWISASRNVGILLIKKIGNGLMDENKSYKYKRAKKAISGVFQEIGAPLHAGRDSQQSQDSQESSQEMQSMDVDDEANAWDYRRPNKIILNDSRGVEVPIDPMLDDQVVQEFILMPMPISKEEVESFPWNENCCRWDPSKVDLYIDQDAGGWWAEIRVKDDTVESDLPGFNKNDFYPRVPLSRLMFAALMYPEGNNWQVMIQNFRKTITEKVAEKDGIVEIKRNRPDSCKTTTEWPGYEKYKQKRKKKTKSIPDDQSEKCPLYLYGKKNNSTKFYWRFATTKVDSMNREITAVDLDYEIAKDFLRSKRLWKNDKSLSGNTKSILEKIEEAEGVNERNLESYKRQFREKVERWKAENKEFKESVRQGALDEAGEEVKNLESDLMEREREVGELQEDVNDLQSKLERRGRWVDELQGDVDDLQYDVHSFKLRIHDLEEEKEDFSEGLDNYDNVLQIVQEDRKKMLAEITNIRNENLQLQEDVEKLQLEKRSLMDKLSENQGGNREGDDHGGHGGGGGGHGGGSGGGGGGHGGHGGGGGGHGGGGGGHGGHGGGGSGHGGGGGGHGGGSGGGGGGNGSGGGGGGNVLKKAGGVLYILGGDEGDGKQSSSRTPLKRKVPRNNTMSKRSKNPRDSTFGDGQPADDVESVSSDEALHSRETRLAGKGQQKKEGQGYHDHRRGMGKGLQTDKSPAYDPCDHTKGGDNNCSQVGDDYRGFPTDERNSEGLDSSSGGKAQGGVGHDDYSSTTDAKRSRGGLDSSSGGKAQGGVGYDEDSSTTDDEGGWQRRQKQLQEGDVIVPETPPKSLKRSGDHTSDSDEGFPSNQGGVPNDLDPNTFLKKK